MLPLASFSVLLIVLGIAHLLWVDSSRQPVSIIFYLTYDSLQNSLTMHPQDLHSVRKILDIINLLSVIVPSLFCAFMPSVLLTPQQGWTESILTQRVKAGRRLCLVASAFLVAGVFHMFAWMKWSSALLDQPDLSQLIISIVIYWSLVYSSMIAVIYFSVITNLNERGESLIANKSTSKLTRQESLAEFGLAVNGITQVRHMLTILAPAISAFTIS